MSTVPAQSFSAPARAVVIAAARVMPGVCGVFVSSSPARTTRTPLSRQSVMRTVCNKKCLSPFVAGLLRRHPQRAVEADRLAVEHRVLRDVAGEQRVLVRVAEPRRVRDGRAERL